MLTHTDLVRLSPAPLNTALADVMRSLHLGALLPISIGFSYGWAGLVLPLLLRFQSMPLMRIAAEGACAPTIPPCSSCAGSESEAL